MSNFFGLNIMQDPNEWPQWPYLPMKHSSRRRDVSALPGLLYHSGEDEFWFYENMNIHDENKWSRINNPDLKGGIEMLRKLVEDGWLVD